MQQKGVVSVYHRLTRHVTCLKHLLPTLYLSQFLSIIQITDIQLSCVNQLPIQAYFIVSSYDRSMSSLLIQHK